MTTERRPPSAGPTASAIPRRTLSTRRIVFLVVAAAAPLAAMVGNVPLALRLTDAPGLPGAFVLATLVLLCFAIGYGAMSKRVVNTGAFYTYVARGLGKPPAVAVALVAVLSYNAMAIGLTGGFGYFAQVVLGEAGINVSWVPLAALGWGITAFLGYRSVELSAKVLAVLMSAEVIILTIFDLTVVSRDGASALPLEAFAPSTVFSASLGIWLMFAFASFIGFESAALYGEEAEDPTHSIPRATMTAVVLIGAFYCLTSWIIVGAGGVAQAAALSSDDVGDLVFNQAEAYLGETFLSVLAVFFVTSVLASLLAIHNAASRYMFALGREGLLPRRLGQFHPRRYAPSFASATQSIINAVVVLTFAALGFSPYLDLGASMVGLSTLGIVALQAVAAISIIAFFWRRPDRDLWRTTIAPAVGAVGLTIATILLALHYTDLTQTDALWVKALPVLLLLTALGGWIYAIWLRRNRPLIYADLAETDLRGSGERTASVVDYTGRYCVVGAGPAGLIMARSLMAEGIPFDVFERHDSVGGIWDQDNPGSPMYDSAHFISSKMTSSFYGYPMPDSFPDYPRHDQILDYVRGFADLFGVEEHVTFGVGVVQATPVEGGWEVELSTGERRHYAGVICANGVTWHPYIPQIPGLERFAGEVRHSVTYRSAREFQDRRVLIVGAGNSGVDIACDAAGTATEAYLSLRRGYRFVPKHLFGIPTDHFINHGGTPPAGVVVPDDPTALVDALVGDLTRYGLPAPDHRLLESHPIMNTQVLHHLAHGDLTAMGDVREVREHSVVFADGAEVAVDLILLATGYDYAIPYVDPQLFEWVDGRPDLWMRVVHPTIDGLYVLGFIELADAAYRRFDEMAQLIVMDIHAHVTGEHLEELRELRRTDRPQLRGGMAYVDSRRHTAYVEAHTYQRHLAALRDRFGFPTLDERTYETLRRVPR